MPPPNASPTPAPHIRRFYASGYGCLRDVSLDLTPLHAVIGPNDSGKSTLLRGVRTLLQATSRGFYYGNGIQPFDPGIGDTAENRLRAVLDTHASVEIVWSPKNGMKSIAEVPPGDRKETGTENDWVRRPDVAFEALHGWDKPSQEALAPLYGGSRLLRLDPDRLRLPGPLLVHGAPLHFDEFGVGLAAILDVLMNRGDDTFREIVQDVRRLFPAVDTLRLENVSQNTKALAMRLRFGEIIKSDFMSEGLLYYLAFRVLRHLDPVFVLLVEEPENGLHPARIREVVRMLREISKTTQVLLATHSPLVVNELTGDEVTLLTRSPDMGTQAVRMCDTPDFAERSEVYTLGELWLAYADGDQETRLRTPRPRRTRTPGAREHAAT